MTFKKIKAKYPVKKEQIVKINRKELKLTNLSKIYWPKEKITKGEMIEYYREIAPVILPYLKNRPLTLRRFPAGITDTGFYQKNIKKEEVPEWFQTHGIYSKSSQRQIHYAVCNDSASLIYLANYGVIEIHPWSSRVKNLNNPDYIMFDLDPTGAPFSDVIKVAKILKKILDSIEVTGFIKTSGGKGLHIYIPIKPKYLYKQVKQFAKIIGLIVHEKMPEITTLDKALKGREKKILIDIYQNGRGQTMVAPYSLRSRKDATVSAPIKWSELNSRLKIENFNIKNMSKRVARLGDIWEGIFKTSMNMEKTLKMIEKIYGKEIRSLED